MRSVSLPLKIAVLRDRAEIMRWAGAWSVLLKQQDKASPAQGPDYCLTALDHALPPHAAVAVIAATRGGMAVGIWPLWIVREGGISFATHIGGGSNEEYAGPIGDDHDALAAMLDIARKIADVLLVCGLPSTSPLVHLARGLTVHRQAVLSPVVQCASFSTFDAWLGTKSRNFRAKMRASHRALAAAGALRTGRVQAHEIEEAVDWLFDTKCAWPRERGIDQPWFSKPSARAFAKAALRNPNCKTICNGLWLDDKLIAAEISLRGHSYELFITTYDSEMKQFSPGQILQAESLKQAIDLNLNFDMRITHEAYKLRWSDDFDPRVTLFFANGPRAWGKLFQRYLSDFRRIAGRLRRRMVDPDHRAWLSGVLRLASR